MRAPGGCVDGPQQRGQEQESGQDLGARERGKAVRSESALRRVGKEERPEITQCHVGLREEIGISVLAGLDKISRGHGAGEFGQGRSQDGGRTDFQSAAPIPRNEKLSSNRRVGKPQE